jgi:putative ATPase
MKEESLFSLANENESTPLADRVRPQNLSEFVGQDDLIGPGKILRELIEKDRVPSLILWGPPGTGKTIVFIDEIHRFNKAQQDAFLPFVERGSITLIGATTENPSFSCC